MSLTIKTSSKGNVRQETDGDINITGGSGTVGTPGSGVGDVNIYGVGGSGGSTIYGFGGSAGGGTGFGAGGSGGGNDPSFGAGGGGGSFAGRSGVVIIWY